MDFHQALNTVIAELTPQPWDYTTNAGTTLTVIPAGLPESEGFAEVMLRITASKAAAAEVGVATMHMATVLHAIDTNTELEHVTGLYDELLVTPSEDGGLHLTVTEIQYDPRREVTTTIYLPEPQRLPLASALRRATDVARGWED
jgi:hypothetical protein